MALLQLHNISKVSAQRSSTVERLLNIRVYVWTHGQSIILHISLFHSKKDRTEEKKALDKTRQNKTSDAPPRRAAQSTSNRRQLLLHFT